MPDYLVNHKSLIIHHKPTREVCNADDLTERVEIHEKHAVRLVNQYGYRWCKHCNGKEE